MQAYGLTYVNARKECAAIVDITDINIQTTFLPVLSMTNPNNGLATAEIVYTNETIKFASPELKSYFSMKKILSN